MTLHKSFPSQGMPLSIKCGLAKSLPEQSMFLVEVCIQLNPSFLLIHSKGLRNEEYHRASKRKSMRTLHIGEHITKDKFILCKYLHIIYWVLSFTQIRNIYQEPTIPQVLCQMFNTQKRPKYKASFILILQIKKKELQNLTFIITPSDIL